MMNFLRRIFRVRDPLATIDPETYMRWLEAVRPPLAEFCRRPEEEQDSLALLGLQYVRAQALANAKALQDPGLWEAEHFGTTEELENAIAERLAEQAYADHVDANGLSRFDGIPPAIAEDPRVDPAKSMVGALADRADDDKAARIARNRRLRSTLQPRSHDNSEAKT